jgi:hypothetical protein
VADTLFFRQIHPTFLQNGNVSSEAFRPTEEHAWKLSLYDGSLITADSSWNHYTKVQKKQSAAVMALDSVDCSSVNLPVIPSPEFFPEHCHLDFAGSGTKVQKKMARKLRDKARLRGFVFQPTV